ncbi:MAG: hypothetical protein AMK72_11175 [Planctomycetes bacterium SM23_25]|nr:MAG: hypothetical protein AMK72_11175 [Planctomycetes bacterium SM23_25]
MPIRMRTPRASRGKGPQYPFSRAWTLASTAANGVFNSWVVSSMCWVFASWASRRRRLVLASSSSRSRTIADKCDVRYHTTIHVTVAHVTFNNDVPGTRSMWSRNVASA